MDMEDTRLTREDVPKSGRSNEDMPRLATVGVINDANPLRRNSCHSIRDIDY